MIKVIANEKRKLILALVAVVCGAALAFGLAGCGGGSSSASASNSGSSASASSASSAASSASASASSAAASSDDKTITVAASPTPHAQILNDAVKPLLEKEGYKLVVKEFNDYVLPNTATEEGEVDANYFQHIPYLEEFNVENKTHLVSVAAVHYEPFGLYAGKTKSIDALADGASVAVPNDTTNEARALLLLEQAGLIKLKEGAGVTATVADIAENPKNLKINELEAAAIPNVLPDVDIAAINSNYALGAGLSVGKDALVVESANGTAAQTYKNIVVVKEGNQDTAKTKALVKAIEDPSIATYINEHFEGAVLPVK